MDISKIKAFDDIWFDCMGNLKISLLMFLDEKYKKISYINDYKYYCRHVSTDSCELNILETFTSWEIIGDLFSERKQIIFENEELFLMKVKKMIKKGIAVFVGVDLFYWIEENFCRNKEHWFHHTMVQRYDEEHDVFYVFDVSDDKKYGIFPISSKDFINAINKGREAGYESYYCDILENVSVKNVSVKDLIDNAHKRIENLKDIHSAGYWIMPPIEYKKGAYNSLNIVHLGRIVQRNMANVRLFRYLYENGYLSREDVDKLNTISEELINGWSMIRVRVNILYIRDFDKEEISKINDKLNGLFDIETKMWELFIDKMIINNQDSIVLEF